MNKVILVGELTRDAEVRDAGSSRLANLNVMTLETIVKRDGDTFEKKEFHRVQVWGSSADYVGQLCQGDVVSVDGRIETRSYEKDGGKRYVTQINAANVNVISRGEHSKAVEKAALNEDDVPF